MQYVRTTHESAHGTKRTCGDRYGVESGHHRLIVRISAFDPQQKWSASKRAKARTGQFQYAKVRMHEIIYELG